MSRVIPGNARVVVGIATVPDRFGVQAASLGLMTHTASPASTGGRGGVFTGDRGFGVARWAGRLRGPLQLFHGAAAPVAAPSAARVGLGAGVSGQPGLPSTGDSAADGSLSWLGMGQLGRAGLRG